jgi:hypothetical protein
MAMGQISAMRAPHFNRGSARHIVIADKCHLEI